MSASPTDAPQRANLRFCKAFFEIHDTDDVRRRLLSMGSQELASDPDQVWYLWSAPTTAGGGDYLVRVRGPRLVLEGTDPAGVGRAWRTLEELLEPAAKARVAAGDDLGRFLPRPRPNTADRPENFGPEHEAQVLAEFHAALSRRWADQPQARLGGRTPREAVLDPEGSDLLAVLLETMRRVEQERRERGMAAISVDELERTLYPIDGLEA